MKTRIRYGMATVLTSAVLLAAPVVAQQPAKQKLASIEQALQAQGILTGRPGPISVNWIHRGQEFSYTRMNPQTGVAEVRVFNPKTLQDELLFDSRSLIVPGTTEPLRYRAFQWGADSRHILFQANFRPIYRRSGLSDFYLYDLQTRQLRPVVKNARTAELSPDGTLVGIERGGNMYVYDLAASKERPLTTEGNDSVFNGVYDWVYEEEFGQAQAWNWSPDSRYIAFWQTDERGVPFVQLTNYEGHHPTWIRINYPEVGDHNPRVRIGVVDVHSGQRRWMELSDSDAYYTPRVYWTAQPDTLAIVTLNRPQNHLRLYFFDVRTGGHRLVMQQTSDTWIDIFDFFAGVKDFFTFPAGLREFFWLSDRDGFQHVYRYDYDGRLLNQVTRGPFTITDVKGIDPASHMLYYMSTQASPLQRQLYAIRFDGSGQHQLTHTAGTHNVNMAPGGAYYIDTWSSTTQPRQVELWSSTGRKLTTMESNPGTREWLQTHVYSPQENFSFTTSDGVRLDASMIRPPDFDAARKYPVLVSIYGGPGSQQVYDTWSISGWNQYLAQHGYIVVGLNNRGSGNYGRDFMKVVYGHLGKWESHDFAELARYMARQPYVDGSRIAIQGTSYGGFSTVYTMLSYPGVFTLGIANSAVTDWRLYDTIYTERYMGLIQQNHIGYDSTSTLPRASRLQGHLLLIHSAMDDNVHPQNTMQLLTALENAGKDAILRFYPPGAHGAAYSRETYVLMLKQYTNAMCAYLQPGCVAANLNH